MAASFVVEYGAALSNSNSYCDLATAQNFHDSTGHTLWSSFSTATQQTALVRATMALDKRFTNHYLGHKVSYGQALQHPRWGLWYQDGLLICGSNVIATQLVNATAELALRAAALGELYADPVSLVPPQNFGNIPYTQNISWIGGVIKSQENAVDVIKQSTDYLTIADLQNLQTGKRPLSSLVTNALLAEYPAADMWMEPLLHWNNTKRLVRG
jgi:hypothetical protein